MIIHIPSRSNRTLPMRKGPIAFLFVAASLAFLSACQENTSSIIVNTGASRPFTFDRYYALPLQPAVIATQLRTFDLASQEATDRAVSDITSADTSSALFGETLGNTANCALLNRLSQSLVEWPWIHRPELLGKSNDYAVYIAEKSYVRFYMAYCVGQVNFFNAITEEKNQQTDKSGDIYYLRSANLVIENGATTTVNNFLLSQSRRQQYDAIRDVSYDVSRVLFTLAEKSDPGEVSTDTRFFFKMHYTDDLTADSWQVVQVSVNNDYTDDHALPDFFHIYSYNVRRIRLDDTKTYDLIKIRTSRLADVTNDTSKPEHTIIHAEMVEYFDTSTGLAGYGTHITRAFGCAQLDITADLDGLISRNGTCPSWTTPAELVALQARPGFFIDDAAERRWWDVTGIDKRSADVSADVKSQFAGYAGELGKFDPLWFDFSSDTLKQFFQTSDPEAVFLID